MLDSPTIETSGKVSQDKQDVQKKKNENITTELKGENTYQVTYQVRSHLDRDKNPVPVGDLEGCRTSIQKEPHLHTVYLLQMLLERVN